MQFMLEIPMLNFCWAHIFFLIFPVSLLVLSLYLCFTCVCMCVWNCAPLCNSKCPWTNYSLACFLCTEITDINHDTFLFAVLFFFFSLIFTPLTYLKVSGKNKIVYKWKRWVNFFIGNLIPMCMLVRVLDGCHLQHL